MTESNRSPAVVGLVSGWLLEEIGRNPASEIELYDDLQAALPGFAKYVEIRKKRFQRQQGCPGYSGAAIIPIRGDSRNDEP